MAQGAQSTLQALIQDPSDILRHGCWCAKLNPDSGTSSVLLGGPETVDIVDRTCKLWIQDRRCLALPGGTCHDTNSHSYVLNATSSADATNLQICGLNGQDSCEFEACLVDVYYTVR